MTGTSSCSLRRSNRHWVFSQYSFIDFRAVEAWVNLAITTVLYLEHERITHMQDRRLSQERRQWWQRQRLHGLCHAVRQAK